MSATPAAKSNEVSASNPCLLQLQLDPTGFGRLAAACCGAAEWRQAGREQTGITSTLSAFAAETNALWPALGHLTFVVCPVPAAWTVCCSRQHTVRTPSVVRGVRGPVCLRCCAAGCSSRPALQHGDAHRAVHLGEAAVHAACCARRRSGFRSNSHPLQIATCPHVKPLCTLPQRFKAGIASTPLSSTASATFHRVHAWRERRTLAAGWAAATVRRSFCGGANPDSWYSLMNPMDACRWTSRSAPAATRGRRRSTSSSQQGGAGEPQPLRHGGPLRDRHRRTDVSDGGVVVGFQVLSTPRWRRGRANLSGSRNLTSSRELEFVTLLRRHGRADVSDGRQSGVTLVLPLLRRRSGGSSMVSAAGWARVRLADKSGGWRQRPRC
jgi:hypothetical protein